MGQGYVGLPVAHAAVQAGHTVVGNDIDLRKDRDQWQGHSPVDDISYNDLAGRLDTGRYLPADSPGALGGCSTYIVTVPTPRGVFRDALAATADEHVAFSPERIDPGNSAWRFASTPKAVGGLDAASGKTACVFYEGICDTVVPVDTAEESETGMQINRAPFPSARRSRSAGLSAQPSRRSEVGSDRLPISGMQAPVFASLDVEVDHRP
jgi:UDP-N-acetyl-D-glucosamine dehydrogenase